MLPPTFPPLCGSLPQALEAVAALQGTVKALREEQADKNQAAVKAAAEREEAASERAERERLLGVETTERAIQTGAASTHPLITNTHSLTPIHIF